MCEDNTRSTKKPLSNLWVSPRVACLKQTLLAEKYNCSVEETLPSNSAEETKKSCSHWKIQQETKLYVRTVLNRLIVSCNEINNVVKKGLQANCAFICYPDYIPCKELKDVVMLASQIKFPKQFHEDILAHVSQLVYPGITDHSPKKASSRIQLDLDWDNFQFLIPITICRDSNEVVDFGYSNCFSKTYLGEKEYRTVEVVFDYEQLSTQQKRSFSDLIQLPCMLSMNGESIKSSIANNRCECGDSICEDCLSLIALWNLKENTDVTVTRPGIKNNISKRTSVPKSTENNFSISRIYEKEKLISVHLRSSITFRQLKNKDALEVSAGSWSQKGKRQNMEDRIFISLDLHKSCNIPQLPGAQQASFFAIYDGHGGCGTADYVTKTLHTTFCATKSYLRHDIIEAFFEAFEKVEEKVCEKLQKLTTLQERYMKLTCLLAWCNDHRDLLPKELSVEGITEAVEIHRECYLVDGCISDNFLSSLENTVQELDKKLSSVTIPEEYEKVDWNERKAYETSLSSGSTALALYLRGRSLYLANLGDSKSILCRGGRVACLTQDHRVCSNNKELARIMQTPGSFTCDGYLCGELGVSRAFGNVSRKTGKKLTGLSKYPDVIKLDLRDDDEFIIMGTDGIFDFISPVHAASIIKKSLDSGDSPETASRKLVEVALENHSSDNTSSIVVSLRKCLTNSSASVS